MADLVGPVILPRGGIALLSSGDGGVAASVVRQVQPTGALAVGVHRARDHPAPNAAALLIWRGIARSADESRRLGQERCVDGVDGAQERRDRCAPAEREGVLRRLELSVLQKGNAEVVRALRPSTGSGCHACQQRTTEADKPNCSTQHVSTLLRLQTPRECAASFPPGQMQRDPTFRHLQSSVASRPPDCRANVPLPPHSPCTRASLLDRAGLLRYCPDNKRPWASLPRANHPQPRVPPDYLMGATSRCTGLRCRFTPMRTVLPCVSPCTRRLLSTV